MNAHPLDRRQRRQIREEKDQVREGRVRRKLSKERVKEQETEHEIKDWRGEGVEL